MSRKKLIFTHKKKIIPILAVTILTTCMIFAFYRYTILKHSREIKQQNIESLKKQSKEKKFEETYVNELNLKADKQNYLQKLKDTHSEKKLVELVELAKIESESNEKEDRNSKEQTIKKHEVKSEEESEISAEKPSSSITQPLSKTHEDRQVSESSSGQSVLTTQSTTERTDGLNFNGNHYDIKGFSGVGHVPIDDSVYQWLDYTEHLHLLAERQSPIGRAVRELGVGSKVVVNNVSYTIFNVVSGVVNDQGAYDALSSGQPALTIQSCDTGSEHSTLTIWYARLMSNN